MEKRLETVYQDMEALGVTVFDCPMSSCKALSSADGYVGVDYGQLKTAAEECSVLMHEAGHFFSGAFYYYDCTYAIREQAEYRARKAAIARYIPRAELYRLIGDGLELWELAEHFCVAEELVMQAYLFYRDVQASQGSVCPAYSAG